MLFSPFFRTTLAHCQPHIGASHGLHIPTALPHHCHHVPLCLQLPHQPNRIGWRTARHHLAVMRRVCNFASLAPLANLQMRQQHCCFGLAELAKRGSIHRHPLGGEQPTLGSHLAGS